MEKNGYGEAEGIIQIHHAVVTFNHGNKIFYV